MEKIGYDLYLYGCDEKKNVKLLIGKGLTAWQCFSILTVDV